MSLQPHPDLRIERISLGREGATLLVVDNLVAEPEWLLRKAATNAFAPQGAMFPGVRAKAPMAYQMFLEDFIRPLLREHFDMQPGRFAFPMCHYSLVTTPPQQLKFLQRVPHIDSVADNGLASVHYLFHGDWGGTAFYRHRRTGFEIINPARRDEYFAALAGESRDGDAPEGYINGDNALFERIASVDGVFNRLVLYRRNSLHSGNVDNAHVPPADLQAGRLSVNSFIDVLE